MTNKKGEKRHIFAQNFEIMYYKIIRQRPEGKSVRGALYRTEHRFSRSKGICKEYLTKICDTLENADCLIPALIYRIAVTQSPNFKRLLPVLQHVPGRTGIRIHRGTKPEHSKGCILVSDDDERKLTEMWLEEQKNHQETRLEMYENNRTAAL